VYIAVVEATSGQETKIKKIKIGVIH
jgi:hypothetical protein